MESLSSAISLMQSAPAAVLSTLEEDGSPCTRAMLNLRNRTQYPGLIGLFEDRSLLAYFTTNTSSPKLRQIRQDNRVSVYYMLPDQWWGLSLYGKMEEVHSQEIRQRIWQDGWQLYYPGGPDDEDYTILRLQPQRGQLYKQLQSWSLKPSI